MLPREWTLPSYEMDGIGEETQSMSSATRKRVPEVVRPGLFSEVSCRHANLGASVAHYRA